MNPNVVPRHRGGIPTVSRRRDWGWIELLSIVTTSPRARGHLFAIDTEDTGSWRGVLESVHLRGGAPLRPGPYIARFERGPEYQHVDLRLDDGVEVTGEDALPALVTELAEGE